jgi:hypothetical protein
VEFLFGLIFEVLGLALFEVLWELLRVLGRAFLELVLPSRPVPGPHPLLVCVSAAVAGAVMGAVGHQVMPARVAPGSLGPVATWTVLPLAGGLFGQGLDLLRRAERREPALAFVAGAAFGLAYLAARAGARALAE